MNDMVNIIKINAHIQHTEKLFLLGKEVLCVSLDRTCTFAGEGEVEVILTDAQLDDLLGQTYGKAPVTRINQPSWGITNSDSTWTRPALESTRSIDEALVVDSGAIAINDDVKILPRGE